MITNIEYLNGIKTRLADYLTKDESWALGESAKQLTELKDMYYRLCDILCVNPDHREKAIQMAVYRRDLIISRNKEVTELKDKLSRRNMQIKDLKALTTSNYAEKDNLHSRIDVLEKIVKDNNLWQVYCITCDNNR